MRLSAVVNMKAIIMAAGKGTRMLPLTEDIPKVLIDIAGKPFLYYVFTNLKQAGFEDIGIIVSYKKEKIATFLDEYGFKAELIEQDDPKGTGDAVMKAEKFAGNSQCVVLGGDNLWSAADLSCLRRDDDLCYVFGQKSEHPELYGVLVTDDDGFLTKIVEKPQEFAGDLVNTGLYKFTPEIFEALHRIKLSERGEYELTDAITMLAVEKKVKVLAVKDYWLDLGCKEDIPKITEFIKSEIITTSK